MPLSTSPQARKRAAAEAAARAEAEKRSRAMLPDYADVPRWPLTEKYVAGQTHKARRTIERTDDLAGTGWGEQSMREAEIVRKQMD